VSKINLITEHVQNKSEFIYRFQFWRKTAHGEVEMESIPEWSKLEFWIVEENINQFETELDMYILRRKKIYGDNDDEVCVNNYELTLTDDDDDLLGAP
jgi:hypothetical protein